MRTRLAYLRTTVAPLDGMWESTEIAQSAFWDIRLDHRSIGHLCIGSENRLLRYHLADGAAVDSSQLFRRIIREFKVERAVACTNEPFYFSSCLDLQAKTVVQSYLFHDASGQGLPPDSGNPPIERVRQDDLDSMAAFYRTNIEGDTAWTDRFVSTRISRGELFSIDDGKELLAAGECISSVLQPPYADLGVLVARSARSRGIGTYMLRVLKEHCYRTGLRPICSCAADNHASRRAIERAGFATHHRLVEMQFAV